MIWLKKMNALAGPEVRLTLNNTKIKKNTVSGRSSLSKKNTQLYLISVSVQFLHV